MVVMAAKEKVGAKVRVLLPAVARNVRWVGDAEASPQFIIFLPGLYLLHRETGHREVERRRQICDTAPNSKPEEAAFYFRDSTAHLTKGGASARLELPPGWRGEDG